MFFPLRVQYSLTWLQNALKLLETRRRKARPNDGPGLEGVPLNGIPSAQAAPTFRGIPSLVGMRKWLQLLGHSVKASRLRQVRAFTDLVC